MKKLWLTGLLAVLGISAVYGWRHRHATRVEFSGTAANATAEAGEATSTVTALSRANWTTAAVSRATGYLASGAKQDVVAARQYKREWDYNYFSSLTNASPGSPIRFVLTDGVFATGAIHHLEHTHGEWHYVSGELTSPEPGRFFFQKQTLSGKQGDFAGMLIQIPVRN